MSEKVDHNSEGLRALSIAEESIIALDSALVLADDDIQRLRAGLEGVLEQRALDYAHSVARTTLNGDDFRVYRAKYAHNDCERCNDTAATAEVHFVKDKGHQRLRDAVQNVLDAYQSRFETGAGHYYGPIDGEIRALAKALRELKNHD